MNALFAIIFSKKGTFIDLYCYNNNDFWDLGMNALLAIISSNTGNVIDLYYYNNKHFPLNYRTVVSHCHDFQEPKL